MFVRLFKSQDPFNIILLLVLVYLLRLPYLFNNEPIPVFIYNEPFSVFMFSKLNFIWSHKTWNVIITGLIYFAQALWLNKIVSDFSLLFKNSYLPALLFVIITSVFSTFFALDAAIFIIFFQLLLLTKLFNLYKHPNAVMIALDAGIITAIASLFYFPSVVWLLATWTSLIIFRSFNWREWVAGLSGMLIPYMFVALYYFWNDDLTSFYLIWKPLKGAFWQINVFPQTIDYLPLLPMLLMLVTALNKLRENFYKNVVHVRKCQQVLIVFILITALSYYIKPSFRVNHFILLAAPLSVFLSYYFLVAKRNWLSEGLMLLTILSILFFQLT